MKYKLQVELDIHRDRVLEIFENTDHLQAWQPGLQKYELLRGEAGEVGSVTLLVHSVKGREIEMIETITQRNSPQLTASTYEAKGVWNEVVNRFRELPGDRTLWQLETEFRCTGLMWLMATLAPWTFKKETRVHMERFKEFAEGLAESRAEAEAEAEAEESSRLEAGPQASEVS